MLNVMATKSWSSRSKTINNDEVLRPVIGKVFPNLHFDTKLWP